MLSQAERSLRLGRVGFIFFSREFVSVDVSQSPARLAGGAASHAARAIARCSNAEARALVSYERANALKVLPLGILRTGHGEVLSAAYSGGEARELLSKLRFATGLPIKLIAVNPADLEKAIFCAYFGADEQLNSEVDNLKVLAAKEREVPRIEASFPESEIPRFLRALVSYARAHDGSDIHLCPRRTGVHLALRINGELHEHRELIATLAQHERMLRFLKGLAKLNLHQTNLPQDGRVTLEWGAERLDLRVSFLPTIYGERVAMRIPVSSESVSLADLGFDSRTHSELQVVLDREEGAILFAGATGSGKTTSLYSSLQYLTQRGLAIATLEDPIEREIAGVAQTQVNPAQGLTYGASLRAVLRQDPDVIMVGELREAESAQVALQAALSGHLLLSTVHARSVFDIPARLKYLGISPMELTDALSLLVVQRLLPRLCQRCRVTDLMATHALGFEAFKAAGCNECQHLGVAGRVLVAESLSIDGGVRDALLRGALGSAELRAVCNEDNYSSPQKALHHLVESGMVAAGAS